MVLLSFCIPVFNQSELVRMCIQSIISYKGNEIEIVISDDCSNEDIRKLVDDFNDERIHYYRNEQNLGHDRNIIASFRKATADFAFLLRTRDTIISENIPDILNIIKKIPQVSYITASALNEKGGIKSKYQYRVFKKGQKALEAHNNLFIHPSGSIYCIKTVDLDEMENFLVSVMDTRQSFIVHNLLRMSMSQEGDFVLLDVPIWIYASSCDAKDVAVNSSNNGESVYSSRLCTSRYVCEMKWCKEILPQELRLFQYIKLFDVYLNQCTWGYKLSNSNKKMQKHYSYNGKKVKVRNERIAFLIVTENIQKKLMDKFEIEKFNYIKKTIINKNKTKGFLKYIIVRTANFFKLDTILEWLCVNLRYSRRLK